MHHKQQGWATDGSAVCSGGLDIKAFTVGKVSWLTLSGRPEACYGFDKAQAKLAAGKSPEPARKERSENKVDARRITINCQIIVCAVRGVILALHSMQNPHSKWDASHYRMAVRVFDVAHEKIILLLQPFIRCNNREFVSGLVKKKTKWLHKEVIYVHCLYVREI